MAMPSESYEAPASTEQPASRARRHPDEEAMLLMMKVVERVEVAKSFAKIATGLVAGIAANAAVQLRAAADAKMSAVVEREGGLKSRYDRMRTIAKAATDAAVHVATHRPPAEPKGDATPADETETETETEAAAAE